MPQMSPATRRPAAAATPVRRGRTRVGRCAALALTLLACTLVLPGAATAGGTADAAAPRSDRTNLGFTASNGLSSRYHLYAAGLPTSTRPCAVFQFHGDGAYEFLHPTSSYSLGGRDGIVAAARAHGCLTVPVLTPDTVGARTWWENGTANARFAHDLIGKITSDYAVDPTRVWLVGYSGGSQLITQFYLPLYPGGISGGEAVLFGGGGIPRTGTEGPYAAGFRAAFRLHWFTGADDNGRHGSYDALRDAKAGEAHYRARGFSTSHEYPAGTGHALDGRFGSVLERRLELHG